MSIGTIDEPGLYPDTPSFSDIEIWYGVNEGGRRKTFEAFQRLQEQLGTSQDALGWLYAKYHKEDLSLEEILKLPIFGTFHFISKATLHRVLFHEDALGWQAKENTQRTTKHDQDKMMNFASVRDHVNAILSSQIIPSQGIDIREYNKMRYPLQRLFYILEKLGGITEGVIEEVFDKNEISSEIFIQILNEKAKAFVSLSGLTLQDFTPKTGSALRNYFMKKLEKQVA